MTKMMTTKEVARYLNVNEKMVYALIADKGLPATKVTGKWLFPEHLVEQWLENNAINFPEIASPLTQHQGLLVLAGSNDILLDRAIGLYNETHRDHLAVSGRTTGGLLRHVISRRFAGMYCRRMVVDP